MLFLLILGSAFILSIPTIYSFLTYYQIPETTFDIEDSYIGYWETTDSICVTTYIGGYWLMPQVLMYKILIDGEVIPLYEIHVIDNHGSHWMDGGFPADDFVCTAQTDLTVGKHELIMFTFYVGKFEWMPQKRSVFYVDELGKITNDLN